MENFINEYGSFLLLIAVISLVVYAETKYRPKMMARVAALDVERWISRLEYDMQICTSLERLDHIDFLSEKVLDTAKGMVSDIKPYADRLLKAYYNKRFDLVNIEHAGCYQSYLPFLSY